MRSPEVPAELPFAVRLRTRWSDEDTQGVLNNAVLATLLEEARHAYFGRLGLLDDNRFPFVLLQTCLRFLSPGRGGREVEVGVATTAIGRSSFAQAYRVTDVADGRVLCEAEALCVAWDPERRAGRPLDEEFQRRLEAGPAPG